MRLLIIYRREFNSALTLSIFQVHHQHKKKYNKTVALTKNPQTIICSDLKINTKQQQFKTLRKMSNASQLLNPTLRIGQQQSMGLIKKQLTPEQKQTRQREMLGDKILDYIKSAIWIAIAGAVIYYSNFFHHLFNNQKINPLFFEICVAAYVISILLVIYISLILPVFFGVNQVEQYNPKLIPIGAVVGVVAVISLLVAIWPVWGFSSLLIFICIWKGFFGLAIFLPGGQFGNFLFMVIVAATILSFYVIEHEGYFH